MKASESRPNVLAVATDRGLKSRNMDLVSVLMKSNVFLIMIVLVAAGTVLSPVFLTKTNILNIFQQSSVVGIIAVGETFVIIAAGIDLSVGSVGAFSGVFVGMLFAYHFNSAVCVVLSVLVGVVFGLIMGYFSSYVGLPSFIVTLAGLDAISGATFLLTGGNPENTIPNWLATLGSGTVDGVSFLSMIFVGTVVLAALVLRFTVFGEYLYAAGSNPEAARLSGVPVARIVMLAFVISGGLSALAGVLLTAWLTTGQPTALNGIELNAIAAVVLGGCSLFGGRGGVIGTFVGVLVLTLLEDVFDLMGLNSFVQDVAIGVVLVGGLLVGKIVADRAGAAAS